MSILEDLTDKEFEMFTVLRRAKNGKGGATRWVVRCKCGTITTASASNLKRGHANKCRECRRGPLSNGWKGGKANFGSVANLKHKVRRSRHAAKKRGHMQVLTPVHELQKLAMECGGRCAISGIDCRAHGQYLCLDHDHTTGKARGFISSKLNSIIGLCDENPTVLRLVADYIEKHKNG